MGDGAAWRHHHVENERIVIGRDDRDHVRSGRQLEVTIVTAEVFDDPDVSPIGVYMRAPWLDVELYAAKKAGFSLERRDNDNRHQW